jgi:predicted negative regulator of RcsB-dependent stress response
MQSTKTWIAIFIALLALLAILSWIGWDNWSDLQHLWDTDERAKASWASQ